MQEFAAEIAELHQLAVDLKIVEHAHALLLRHLVFIQAVPHVGVDEVRAAHGVAVVRDLPRAAGDAAVGLHDLLVVLIQLMPLRAVVDKMHAELRRDEAGRGAHLRAVADEDDLAVLELFALRQVLHDRAQIADFLRGVVVVGHAVDDRDRAGFRQIDDGLVVDHARHYDVHELGEHLARVADGLMTAELDHAGSEILRVAAHLAHRRLERDARARGRLLEDHAQRHIFHQRGIISVVNRPLGQRQVDDVQQLLLCKFICVDKIFVHRHSSLKMRSGVRRAAGSKQDRLPRLVSAVPRQTMRSAQMENAEIPAARAYFCPCSGNFQFFLNLNNEESLFTAVRARAASQG